MPHHQHPSRRALLLGLAASTASAHAISVSTEKASTPSPASSLSSTTAPTSIGADNGGSPALDVVILGSGGPELSDKRASVSYLVREGGKARFLIDMGTGAALNFKRADARIEDLYALLLTHFHVDHVNDLPAFVMASFFSSRQHDLPIYGPSGDHGIPALPDFLQRQFGSEGAYPYLADFLNGDAAFALRPTVASTDWQQPHLFQAQVQGFTVQAIAVHHGRMPALGWRIAKNGCAVTISGDTNNQGHTLDMLARPGDLFIAHNAVPESSQDEVALQLHMRPSEIGRIAARTGSRAVVLTHFMRRTEQAGAETSAAIRRHYSGPLFFAQDMDQHPLLPHGAA